MNDRRAVISSAQAWPWTTCAWPREWRITSSTSTPIMSEGVPPRARRAAAGGLAVLPRNPAVGEAGAAALQGGGRRVLPGVVADAVQHLGGEVARLQQAEQAHALAGVVEAAGADHLQGGLAAVAEAGVAEALAAQGASVRPSAASSSARTVPRCTQSCVAVTAAPVGLSDPFATSVTYPC